MNFRVTCMGSTLFQSNNRIDCENYMMRTYDKFPNHKDLDLEEAQPVVRWVKITRSN